MLLPLLFTAITALANPASDDQQLYTERIAAAEQAWSVNQLQTAASLFGEAQKLQPDIATPYRRQCGVYLDIGRYDDAEALCRQALEMDPNDPSNHLGLARVLMIGGGDGSPHFGAEGLSSAEDLVDKAIAMKPDLLSVWQTSCMLAAQTEDAVRMDSCVQFLLANDPTHPGTMYHQSLLKFYQGDLRGAFQTLERAQSAGLDGNTAALLFWRIEQASMLPTKADGDASIKTVVPLAALGFLLALMALFLLSGQRRQES